jgi:hypothetical protein
LRKELLALGMDQSGSRSELTSKLIQAGVYDIDLTKEALPPKIDTSNRSPNITCVYIGNGAGLNEIEDNKLYIANSDTASPLIKGDFFDHKVTIANVLSLECSEVCADLQGEEGDLRRKGSNLFMYRKTECIEGWYPMVFGLVELI